MTMLTASGPIAAPAEITALTDAKWVLILGWIAEGMKPGEAVAKAAVHMPVVQGFLRSNKTMLEAWREASVAARRRDWDFEVVEAICTKIATGATVKTACLSQGRRYEEFLHLVLKDAQVREDYETAKKIRAEMQADEIIDIADDDGDDLDMDGRGNSAAVKRSELRVKTRLEVMKANNREKFSEYAHRQGVDVKVEVNVNHAERLEAARQRERQGREPITIEGERAAPKAPKPAPVEDTGWLD